MKIYSNNYGQIYTSKNQTSFKSLNIDPKMLQKECSKHWSSESERIVKVLSSSIAGLKAQAEDIDITLIKKRSSDLYLSITSLLDRKKPAFLRKSQDIPLCVYESSEHLNKGVYLAKEGLFKSMSSYEQCKNGFLASVDESINRIKQDLNS